MARIRKAPASAGLSEETLLDGLNPEQRQVALHDGGPVRVKAGPGAGKTASIVRRIGYLVAQRRVTPNQILAVTFSKKAADEMNERVEKLLGPTDARVGTWHSLALEIVRAEMPGARGWDIDDRDRYRTIVKTALGYQGIDWKGADLTTVLRFVGECKASLALPGSEKADAIAAELYNERPCQQTDVVLLGRAYEQAERLRIQQRLITFDDMLVEAWKCFTDRPDALASWQARYRYLIVDEAQDNNEAQAALTQLLGCQHRNVMAVGDIQQAIYGFRGARPEIFARFVEEWAPASEIVMHRNYRSGVDVVEAANRISAAMPPNMSLGAAMESQRGTSSTITTTMFASLDDEGEAVALRALEAHASGVEWREQVVLFRTNAQSRGVEEAMLRNRIPYVVLGGTNFYDRREIKDLLAYLRVADGRGDFDDVRRCINAPFRFLGKAFTEKLSASHRKGDKWTATARQVARTAKLQSRQVTAVDEWAALIDSIERSIERRQILADEVTSATGVDTHDQIDHTDEHNVKLHMPAAILERLLNDTDYLRYITRDEGAESPENNRVSNVRELIRAAERFTTVAELLDYVDLTLAAAKRAKATGERNSVTLCSIHRSKGLEWPIVFLVGCNEKILPHGRADDVEEERRLFFVGVTRAKDELHVSHVRSAAFGDRVVRLEPSRFLSEAGFIAEAAE